MLRPWYAYFRSEDVCFRRLGYKCMMRVDFLTAQPCYEGIESSYYQYKYQAVYYGEIFRKLSLIIVSTSCKNCQYKRIYQN